LATSVRNVEISSSDGAVCVVVLVAAGVGRSNV